LNYIEVKHIQTNNLKDINIKVPLKSFIVVVGPSGSGKTSLVVDTLAEEGKKRLLQVLNPGEIWELPKHKAEFITSLPPVILVSQGSTFWHPYKSVAEVIGIVSFLQFLFFRYGEYYCLKCKSYTRISSIDDVCSWFHSLKDGTKFYFLVPIKSSLKGLEYLLSQGFTKYFFDDQEVDLSEEEPPKNFKKIYLVLDRMVKYSDEEARLLENIRLALSLGAGVIGFRFLDGREKFLSIRPVCNTCGESLWIDWQRCKECSGLGYKEKNPCKKCKGLKLEESVLLSKVFSLTFEELLKKSVKEFLELIKTDVLEGVYKNRLCRVLDFLVEFGAENLKLFEPMFGLTSGEKKLLELAQVFSLDLRGCVFIFDEPAMGMTISRRKQLFKKLAELKTSDNTVILIEHDPLALEFADYIIELGPSAGIHGGYLVFAGSKEEFLNSNTQTSNFLKGERRFLKTRSNSKKLLEFSDFKVLEKGINVFYPVDAEGLKAFEVLRQDLKEKGAIIAKQFLTLQRNEPVASYSGLWDGIREFLIHLPSARAKGLKTGHFSFFTKQGACPECKGKGKVTLKFNGTKTEVLCTSCMGYGLNKEVLELEFKGFKVFELLEMTVEEILQVFQNVYKVKEQAVNVCELGLGYLKLSQRINTLSWGEKLRLAIARHLSKKQKSNIILLEHPFQGLHFVDIEKFYKWMKKLIQEGKTLIILETSPIALVIADWIIQGEKDNIMCMSFEDWFKKLAPEEIHFYARLILGREV